MATRNYYTSVVMGSTGPPPEAFVSIWNTANTSDGSSTSTQVKLPLTSLGTYNFDVDWGDGNSDTITAWNQTEVTHPYASSGTYTVVCTPNVPGGLKGFRFNSAGDRLKLLDTPQFGNLLFTNETGAFWGCTNYTGATISDVLNTTGLTTMGNMFRDCTVFNGAITFTDTSSVTSMAQMFREATAFNQPIAFNTSSVTNMTQMFFLATSFNQDISGFDVNQVTSFVSFMLLAGISTVNYDLLLVAWAAQLPFDASARSITFGRSKYTLANPTVVSARNALIAHFTTVFADGGGV